MRILTKRRYDLRISLGEGVGPIVVSLLLSFDLFWGKGKGGKEKGGEGEGRGR